MQTETGEQLFNLRSIGQSDYNPVWEAMQQFTRHRIAEDRDEIWITEHQPVFTQGLNGKSEHLLDVGDIPVVQIDRGGQVTYHGPGQLVIYCMLDLIRLGIGVRSLVSQIEQSIIDCLSEYQITANTRSGAPGVYTDDAKIAALGLRIRKGRCYHGLSLNISMDTEPFSRINPCGFQGLKVSQMADFGIEPKLEDVGRKLSQHLIRNLYRG